MSHNPASVLTNHLMLLCDIDVQCLSKQDLSFKSTEIDTFNPDLRQEFSSAKASSPTRLLLKRAFK